MVFHQGFNGDIKGITWDVICFSGIFNGLVEGNILQETPINLMVKTMVSCRFSLNPMTGDIDKYDSMTLTCHVI